MSGRTYPVRVARRLRLDRPINAVAGSLIGVSTDQPVFHLTFDDGPHPEITPKVLDSLDEHGAKATFFVLTQRAQEHPGLLAEMTARGHEIALHTRTHPRLTDLTWNRLVDEIRHARRDLEEVAQRSITWFRPPYGAQNVRSLTVARASGMKTILWSVDSGDWKGVTADQPLGRAGAGLTPGGILLLHDVPVGDSEHDDTVKGFVPKDELTRLYLAKLARLGLRPTSLDELLSAGIRRGKVKLG